MEDVVSEYASCNGAAQAWKAWRDGMLGQGRSVKPELMEWPIPQPDIELDSAIAQAIIDDFLAWADSHHGIQLCFVQAANAEGL